ERIKKEAPTKEEMDRALNSIESQSVYGMQTVLGKANQMNSYATYVGRPDHFQAELDSYAKVTPADVQRVANKYLTKDRFVMNFVPRTSEAKSVGASAANKPTSAASKESEEKSRDEYAKNLPKPGPNPTFALPSIEKSKLSNGLNVWIVKQSELPIVSMNMVLNSGGTIDPKGRAGLASFTATLLDSGTETRAAVEIASDLQSIGANLRTGSGWDSANISLQTLTKNIDKALDIYSDVILHPSFPESELETLRKRTLVSLLQRKDNPNAIANVAYSALLYGKDHPYGHSLGGDEKSVSAITRDEIEKFYGETYHPNNATLIIVGDTDAKTLMPKLEKAFGKWEAGD